ncbi:GMC oxidoreductase [Alphaproteobacteria bacterium]|nr:GMC oxidoreductase [Alphaproteobacteria bacterium]
MSKRKIVIVGGGTAGLLIAENLKHKFDIVVLEKSEIKKTPFLSRIPLLIGPLYREAVLKYVRKIEIIAQKDRVIPFYESCVLGGASAINGCVHALGSRSNWDIELKRLSLGFDDVSDAYGNVYTKCTYSLSKKIKLRPASHNALDQSFFLALEKCGFSETGLLTSDRSGFGKVINTVGLFFRSSVLSVIGKHKLNIHTGEEVTQIRRTKNKQLEIISKSNSFLADHVILSSGVVGTNLLFLEKRIGRVNDNYLRKYNIGMHIKDHPNVRVNVRSSKSFGSLNEINKRFLKKFFILAKHLLGVDTVLLGTGATSGIHLDLDGDGIVDTRIHLLQFSETGRHKSDGNDFCSGSGFSLSITPIQTMSSGEIIVDESGLPIIDPGFFSNETDLDRMKFALLFCLDLLNSEPLKEYVEEIEDYDLVKNDPDAYIRKTFFSGHHLIGGCSNLIDENFEVKGNPGIFICDASIFAGFVSSNIHAPVILLAKIFSDRFAAKLNCNSNGDENARI